MGEANDPSVPVRYEYSALYALKKGYFSVEPLVIFATSIGRPKWPVSTPVIVRRHILNIARDIEHGMKPRALDLPIVLD